MLDCSVSNAAQAPSKERSVPSHTGGEEDMNERPVDKAAENLKRTGATTIKALLRLLSMQLLGTQFGEVQSDEARHQPGSAHR